MLAMKRPWAVFSVLFLAGLSLALFLEGVRRAAFPLGVRGEWEWLRISARPVGIDLTLAAAGIVVYATGCAMGMRWLNTRASWIRELLAVGCLAVASVAVQLVVQTGAPPGYGLAKWVIALSQKGSSGYFNVARNDVADLEMFLARYPEWISHQDALHIGTHPPGLIVAERGLLEAMEHRPGLARWVVENVPESVAVAFRIFGEDNPMSMADRATLAATGALTLLLCALTTVPMYLLARTGLPAPTAFAAAALWPLTPAAVMFQPTADAAFALLATTAMALAALGSHRFWAALACGLVLGIGMQFTLAFLPAGLIAAVLLAGNGGVTWWRRLLPVSWTGAGFLALTLLVWFVTRANPFVIWWWNQRNHARFYLEYPRTYLAWVMVNPIELAVALGLASALWGCVALARPGALPRVSATTLLVLILLTVTGRNLSEVARLWIPFMPALLVATAAGGQRLAWGPRALATTIVLNGLEILALQTMIQVVYPI